MDSPILKSLFEAFCWDTTSKRALYLQLSDAIFGLIKTGKLQANQKLPSSRTLASWLQLNRVTVSKALDELQMQGWVERFVGKGTFVASYLQTTAPIAWEQSAITTSSKGFEIEPKPYLENNYLIQKGRLQLDDGLPDIQLAPVKELYRAYRNQLTRSGWHNKFNRYGSPNGSDEYCQAISDYLNETRGLHTRSTNILSVRGAVMGINLVCNAFINSGDVVISGIPGWNKAEINFIHAGAQHIGVSVDENGINVEEIRRVCEKQKVRMVYVTPHHHYPTTVSMRMDRRLELLRLANEYGFIIFEDDYDFDFHYAQHPLLPLASADLQGMVIYCGTFSKSFSPAFRMGYLAASERVIQHLAKVRVLLDRQGDQILDNAMAELLQDGTTQRYLKKALKAYLQKRDFFCELLSNELNESVQFTIPEGGMTVWSKFDASINLEKLAQKALQKGLVISNGKQHQYPNYHQNAIRLGFASSSFSQLEESVQIIKNNM